MDCVYDTLIITMTIITVTLAVKLSNTISKLKITALLSIQNNYYLLDFLFNLEISNEFSKCT